MIRHVVDNCEKRLVAANKSAASPFWRPVFRCKTCPMRRPLTASILVLAVLSGCSPASTPRLVPELGSVGSSENSTEYICLAWRKALDGYDAAGERRRLADSLRARGEDPRYCEQRDGVSAAAPLSPSVSGPGPATAVERTAIRPQRRSGTRMSPIANRRALKTSLDCTSELVKGPPDRYKTICR